MSGQDSTLTNHSTFSIPNSFPDTYEYRCFLAMHDGHPAMAIAVFARMLQECQEHGLEYKLNSYIQKMTVKNLRITLYKHFTTIHLEYGI